MTILTALSVIAVLVLGLFSMMKGGEFNKKYGNKLMTARVVLQAITIILLLILWFASSK
jgi:Hypoxia induced protein conserved region